MLISAETNRLANCLETVEKALAVRSTIPVIGNILLQIDDEGLVFSATNHEIFINASMKHMGGEKGVILLPPKIIDIVRHFPTSDINMDISWDNYRLDLSGGTAKFNLYGAAADDFPVSAFDAASDEGDRFNIGLSLFKNILKEVIFAASSEETRPAFNGVLFNFSGNSITLTASDTYRLVVKEIKSDSWNLKPRKCLVPARALREFLRISAESDLEVKIGAMDSFITIEFGNIFFAARLLEEKYPDVSGVIPRGYKTRIIVKRKILEESVARASLLAEGKNLAVNIAVKNGHLLVKVNSQEGSMEEDLTVGQDGDDIDILVNSRFIMDILKIIDYEEVSIDFNGDGGPLVIRIKDDDTYLYLVLPIKKVS